MDERIFEFDNLSIEIAARTIEFWRGEYAKRRVFAENKDNYQAVKEAMKALKDLAEHLYETAKQDKRLGFERDYEVIILDLIADGKLDDSDTLKAGNALLGKLQTAYDLSIQYGYVISDLSLDSPFWIRKNYLLSLIKELEEGYWKKIMKLLVSADHSVSVEQGIWIPRFYGPNSTPWHRTHLLSVEPLPTIERHDVQPDIAFAVKGIGDDEFQIRSTVGKIETDLCKLRIHKLHKKLEILLSHLKDLALDSERMHYEDRQHFKTLDPSTIKSCMDSEIHQVLMDKGDTRLLSMQFPTGKRKEVLTIKSRYVSITKEMLKLFKRLSISTREMLSGPYKGKKAEVSRAKGIYLWDTVHIEGKTDKEALEALKAHIDKRCEGLLVEDSPKDNKQTERLRVTEECIRENRFLPMP